MFSKVAAQKLIYNTKMHFYMLPMKNQGKKLKIPFSMASKRISYLNKYNPLKRQDIQWKLQKVIERN